VLAPDGSGSQGGFIVTAGQTDFYQFVAPLTARLTIQQNAAPASTLDSFLTVFDVAQTQLAQDDNGGGNLNSALTIRVTAVPGRLPEPVEQTGWGRSCGCL
jgi:hypothetical protein